MTEYTIVFWGRKKGAIGAIDRYSATRCADSKSLAVLALYDEFEHISVLTICAMSDEVEISPCNLKGI